MLHDHWLLLTPPPILPPLPVENDKLRAVFARRGVEDADAFRRFTAPAMQDLHDAAMIHGIDHACERIARAVREAGGEVVVVACVVDRETGAQQAIEAEGASYRAILTLADLELPT